MAISNSAQFTTVGSHGCIINNCMNDDLVTKIIVFWCYRCRGKLVRVLDSNPLQILLCVLIFLDALVVLAEIIVDLQSIRGKCFRVQPTRSLKRKPRNFPESVRFLIK